MLIRPTQLVLVFGLTSTQNDRKYAAKLVVGGEPEIVCIAVQVTPLAGTGLRPAPVSAETVQWRWYVGMHRAMP